jgi:hypothetical protein
MFAFANLIALHQLCSILHRRQNSGVGIFKIKQPEKWGVPSSGVAPNSIKHLLTG